MLRKTLKEMAVLICLGTWGRLCRRRPTWTELGLGELQGLPECGI